MIFRAHITKGIARRRGATKKIDDDRDQGLTQSERNKVQPFLSPQISMQVWNSTNEQIAMSL